MKQKIGYKIINLEPIKSEKDGILNVIEAQKQVPFEIKRVFFIRDFKNQNTIRGNHAHKNLQQTIFCLRGKVEISLDNGKEIHKIILDNPTKGIFIDKLIWLKIKILDTSTIILVLASDFFDEKDYILDYKQFVKLIEKK